MALSRGVPLRPQAFVAQVGASPFAALLDAAAAPIPDGGAGTPPASARSDQRNPTADTGAAAQNGAAAPPPAPAPPPGDAAHAPTALDSGAPAQSGKSDPAQGVAAGNANDGKSAPDANDSVNLVPAAPASGAPIQIATDDGAHQTSVKNGADRKPAPALEIPDIHEPAITMPAPARSAAGNPNASSGTSANLTPNATMPFANDPAAADAADASKSASNNTAAALGAAVVANLKGAASVNGVAPGATKPTGDGKDDQRNQDDDSASAATAPPAANQAQLPSPADAAQPVAVAAVVSATPDPAPAAAAKPGLAIGDAVKARTKVMPTVAATAQTAPAQDDSTDAPGSSLAVNSGGSDYPAASSGSDDTTGNASAANAQQATDQVQTPSADGLALLTQIDFASLGGTEHFGLRGETAGTVNSVAGSAAPNGIANTATASNFGIFGLNPIATNIAAPAAAVSAPAVPPAGLAVAIAARAQAGSSQFDIRLDPPELGRIDVRLDVDGSGQVRTHVTVDRPDTLQLLQSQQPQLERALEQAGLKTADNGLQFTLRDQSFAGQNGGAGGQHYANQPAAPVVIPDIEAAPIDTAQIYARLRLGNGLDISV